MSISVDVFTPFGRDALLNDLAEFLEQRIAEDPDDYVNIPVARDHFRMVAEFLRDRLGAHVVSLVFLDPRDQAFETIFTAGAHLEFAEEWWKEVGTHAGIVGDAVDERRSIWTPDVSKYPNFRKIAHTDTVSQLTLLLQDRVTPYAVIAIEWDRSVDEQNAIIGGYEDFGKRLAILIVSFRARIFARRSQNAFDAAREIAEMETTEERVIRVLHAVRKLTGGGEVAVLRRIGAKLIVFEAVDLEEHRVPPAIDIVVEKTNGYVAEVAFARDPFYCDDTSDEARFPLYRRVDESTQCQFSVPLIFRRELVGVLNVGAKQAYAFNHMTRGLLIQFAAHAAAILYNTAVLDGIRAIYDHVRKNLSYLSTVGSMIKYAPLAPDQMSFLQGVERIRDSVEAVWSGLSPIQYLPHADFPTTAEVVSQLRDAIVTEIKDQFKVEFPELEPVIRESKLEKRWINCAMLETLFACQSAVRSAIHAIQQHPDGLEVTITVGRQEYDRQKVHPRLSVATEPVKVSYAATIVDLRVSSRHLAAIPPGNLVNATLSSQGDPLMPVRDLGVNLWACDRVFAVGGGFVGAEKIGEDLLRLSFWLLEENSAPKEVLA